jgi:small conductance mechanosensitive channel
MTPDFSLATLKVLIESDHLPPWAHGMLALLRVSVIVLLWWLLTALARRVIRLAISGMEAAAECPEDRRRIQTLGRVFRYIASVVLGVVTVMLVLNEVGVSIAPILATAGVAGVAVGFGAQSLVKDYFTGFVMLVENQVRVGDVVDLGGKSGVVEEVTLRYVRLRDLEGAVHFVPNGTVSTVSNRSREFAYAVVDVPVVFGNDIERTLGCLRAAGETLCHDPQWQGSILGDLELLGVDHLTEGSVVFRARLRVAALEQQALRRALLRAMVEAVQRDGLRLPGPETAGRPL